jgi:hypothetical protein
MVGVKKIFIMGTQKYTKITHFYTKEKTRIVQCYEWCIRRDMEMNSITHFNVPFQQLLKEIRKIMELNQDTGTRSKFTPVISHKSILPSEYAW